MTLTSDEIKELKNQLKSQTSHLPIDKQKEALDQIDSMSQETIESMVKQQQARSQGKTIFRMIITKEVESVQVGENADSLAVLSTKSISKGHTIIIPKLPATNQNQIPKSAFELAENLTKKISSNLKAKSVRLETESLFGELIINLIPIYDSPLDLTSPKKDISLEELESIKKSLEVIKIEKKPEIIKEKKKKGRKPRPLKLERRIP